jgi:hypothetical protein
VATTPAPATPPDGEFDLVGYTDDPGTGEKVVSRVRYRWNAGKLEQRQPDGTWILVPTPAGMK